MAGRANREDLGPTPRRLLRVLERLREIHADMTVIQLQHLVFVAENPGTTVKEIYAAVGTGINSGNSTKTIALLSEVGNNTAEGFRLVETFTDAKDRRLKRVQLTAKGARLFSDIRRDLGL